MDHRIEVGEVEVLDAEIGVRAHMHWKQRGCPVGDPLQDWYTARAELRRERAMRAYAARVAHFE
jgi:hypothetical protein